MAQRGSLGAMPRLRFDKVALRLVQDIRGALEQAVPGGLCVVFTVTAPIREPSKTTAAVIEVIRAQLSLGNLLAKHEALYGNQIRVQVMKSRLPNAARVAGFVHNPDPPPTVLLEIAQSLLNCVKAPDVARSNGTPPELDTLRRVCGQLLDADGCAKAVAARDQRPARSIRG